MTDTPDPVDADKVSRYLSGRHGFVLVLRDLHEQPDHVAAPLRRLVWDEAADHVRRAEHVAREAEWLRRHSDIIARMIDTERATCARIPEARTSNDNEETQ